MNTGDVNQLQVAEDLDGMGLTVTALQQPPPVIRRAGLRIKTAEGNRSVTNAQRVQELAAGIGEWVKATEKSKRRRQPRRR